jgi:hypothetical protein
MLGDASYSVCSEAAQVLTSTLTQKPMGLPRDVLEAIIAYRRLDRRDFRGALERGQAAVAPLLKIASYNQYLRRIPRGVDPSDHDKSWCWYSLADVDVTAVDWVRDLHTEYDSGKLAEFLTTCRVNDRSRRLLNLMQRVATPGPHCGTDSSLEDAAIDWTAFLPMKRVLSSDEFKTEIRLLSMEEPQTALNYLGHIAVPLQPEDPSTTWSYGRAMTMKNNLGLNEVARNSVIGKLCAVEGRLWRRFGNFGQPDGLVNAQGERSGPTSILPKSMDAVFDWSGVPTIRLTLPGNVYWYRSELKELEELASSNFAWYRQAAGNALAQIRLDGVEDAALQPGKAPSKEMGAQLSSRLKSGEWEPQYRALEALRISGADATTLVAEMGAALLQDDLYISTAADDVLRTTGKAAVPVFIDALIRGSLNVKQLALESICAIEGKEAPNALKQATDAGLRNKIRLKRTIEKSWEYSVVRRAGEEDSVVLTNRITDELKRMGYVDQGDQLTTKGAEGLQRYLDQDGILIVYVMKEKLPLGLSADLAKYDKEAISAMFRSERESKGFAMVVSKRIDELTNASR